MTQESVPSHMRQPALGPARVLLISPTSAGIEVVAELLLPYAPDRLVTGSGVPASLIEACGRELGIEVRQTADCGDAASTLDAVAADAQGSTIALLVPLELVPRIVTYALGVSDEAAPRFEFASNALSVLECDDDGRWAVVRVNEGAWPPSVR